MAGTCGVWVWPGGVVWGWAWLVVGGVVTDQGLGWALGS